MSSASPFPSTRWTLISRCKDGSDYERQRALNELCIAYWLPLYAFARRSQYSPHEAEDLVQGFFLEWLAGDFFTRADESRGRLRSLLCTAFRRHINHVRLHATRQVRGGGAEHVPLLPENAEGVFREYLAEDKASPDVLFHRYWARSVLHRSLNRLGDQYQDEEQRERFRVLREYLPWDGGDDTCDAAAKEVGMSSGAFRTALHRMRKRYRECILSEVRETIDSDDEQLINEEVRELFAALND